MARLQGIPDLDHEFKSLRLSAIRNAVQIAPFVNEITIGPDSSKTFDNATDSELTTSIDGKENLETGVKISKPNSTSERLVQPMKQIQNVTIPYEKMLHDCELKKREMADLMLGNMLKKMAAKRTEMMTKFWQKQELEYEKRSQERRNMELEILQQLALGDKMAKIEQEKLDEENRAHSEKMKVLLKKQLKSTQLFESLNRHHTQMCSYYEEITNISSSDNVIFANILQKYEPVLSSILSSMNIITESCKSGVINEADVDKADFLTNKMKDTKAHVFVEFESATKEYEESLKQAAEISKQTSPEDNTTAVTPVHNSSNSEALQAPTKALTKVKYCSEKSLNLCLSLKKFLNSYEASYKDLLEDDSLKKFRFDLQKAVNIPVNAISSVSGHHIKDKYDKLFNLLNGDRVRVGDSYVSCSQHPQGIAYCTDLLAKKLVRQGEQLASTKPEAAFPIASIIIALWARFPDFGKLILAHFQQDCPYLIPIMMPQCQGQTDEEFYKGRGYRYEDGSVEKQDKFLKRMSGLFRLCAAIWVTKMPNCVKSPHPQGLAQAWRWMAAFVNLDPEADISATLLYDFLTICGAEFFKCYKEQFVKVLNFLMTDYHSRIEKIDEGGPKLRLEVFLQTVIKERRIAPPAGILSDRFW